MRASVCVCVRACVFNKAGRMLNSSLKDVIAPKEVLRLFPAEEGKVITFDSGLLAAAASAVESGATVDSLAFQNKSHSTSAHYRRGPNGKRGFCGAPAPMGVHVV